MTIAGIAVLDFDSNGGRRLVRLGSKNNHDGNHRMLQDTEGEFNTVVKLADPTTLPSMMPSSQPYSIHCMTPSEDPSTSPSHAPTMKPSGLSSSMPPVEKNQQMMEHSSILIWT